MGARKDIYAARADSVSQRVFLTTATGAYAGAAWWLLFGGIPIVGRWFGSTLQVGDTTRRLCLGFALSVYFVRLLFTYFVYLKRALSWAEAAMVGLWLLVIYLIFAVAGGTNPREANDYVGFGVILFLAGSWINSASEYTRHKWKQRAENSGRLYTLGLFQWTRHPNYLGDLIAFTGLCLIAGRWVCLAIPSIMLAGFVFVNIPMLDSHLHDHYGAAFDSYAKRTSKLIPFLY